MKIATWNVNGIRARQAQVCEFLEQEKPDILCLQELKATPEQVPEACKDRKSTRLNSSHVKRSRMPSSA